MCNYSAAVSNWHCPIAAEIGKQYCIFHLPVQEKDPERFLHCLASYIYALFIDAHKLHYFPSETTAEFAKKQSVPYWIIYDHDPDLVNYFLALIGYFNGIWNFTGFIFPNTGRRIIFSRLKFPRQTDFSEVRFNNMAVFSRAQFQNKVWFRNARFYKNADFTQASFCRTADFTATKFRQASFAEALILNDINFSQARFYAADFSRSRIQHGNFIGTRFRNANFTGATLINTSFYGAQFKELGNFSQTNFFKADFCGAQFKQADFQGATFLDSADFSNTQFYQIAKFTGVKYKPGTVFIPGTNLQ